MLSREAIYSSRIEGTVASAEELAMFEADPTTGRERPSVREVWNYLSAAEQGLERVRAEPGLEIDQSFIQSLHRILMSGAQRSNEVTPGEFRHVQNWIGRRVTSIAQARYVPPPPREMFAALDELALYLKAPHESSGIVRIALAHYQFEAIHPFIDGNGRVGRLLVTLLLAKWGFLDLPLLHLSAYFERHINEYTDRMLAVSQRGDWRGWVSFFLTGVAEEADSARQRARSLIALRERYRSEIPRVTTSPNAPRLADFLFSRPIITIPDAARFLGITYAPALSIVNLFAKAGILTERPGKRPRFFVAEEVLALVKTD